MSSFLDDLYLVRIDSSLEYKEEFFLYLKDLLISTVNFKLPVIKQNMGNEDYVFSSTLLPNNSVKSNKDTTILFLSSQNIDILADSDKDTLSGDLDLISKLQTLTPEDPIGFNITLHLDEILSSVFNSLRIFSVLVLGVKQTYFGIYHDFWYPNIPLYLVDVMRTVDFGTLDNTPLTLFYPVFNNFKQNINVYYNAFLNERGKDNANTSEL